MPIFETKIVIDQIRNQLLNYGQQFDSFFFYDSNIEANENASFNYHGYDILAAFGCKHKVTFSSDNPFDDLRKYYDSNPTWLFGYLGYDLKNKIEHLASRNNDFLTLPEINFIAPEMVIYVKGDMLSIIPLVEGNEATAFLNKIEQSSTHMESTYIPVDTKCRINKAQYIKIIDNIKQHIYLGDIYEMNYCMPFEASYQTLNGIDLYRKLNSISKAPFAAYARINEVEIICASPERFLKKDDNLLISQPIKGTQKRGTNNAEDEALKLLLKQSKKEQSENVMIVDLVRNDLSISAKRNTVKVEELFGVYSFMQVHQMISTITAELNETTHFVDAIKNAFPMGSMTGAPKIKAMQLIEEFEVMKRGIYSGALGYISPSGNFDFNVVIRSIILNNELKKLQFCVGSAITAASEPELEYEECLLKVKALLNVLA